MLDLLIERNPLFRDQCREIRERMNPGQFQAHEEVRRQLLGDRAWKILVGPAGEIPVEMATPLPNARCLRWPLEAPSSPHSFLDQLP
jgi:hypothetical protein